jgi:hypothetical protein
MDPRALRRAFAAAFILTLAAAAWGEGVGKGQFEPVAVPTLPMAVGDATSIVRVEVLGEPTEGDVPVEVCEVYWGDFENTGWVDPTYLVPDDTDVGSHYVRFEFHKGEQYILLGWRGPGGVYKPFLHWNTSFGVLDIYKGKVDLSRLAEGPREIPIAEFRELVKRVKYAY